MSNAVSAAILRQVLTQVKKNGGQFSAEHGEMLVSIHHSDNDMALLQVASELVEKERVTRVVAMPSQRSFFRVASQSHHGANVMYICFPHFCSCAAFSNTTVKGGPSTMVRRQYSFVNRQMHVHTALCRCSLTI
jgi:hypothetical protein